MSVAMLMSLSEVRMRREIGQANFHKRVGIQAPFPHHQHQSDLSDESGQARPTPDNASSLASAVSRNPQQHPYMTTALSSYESSIVVVPPNSMGH
jgi:hypothetical protein